MKVPERPNCEYVDNGEQPEWGHKTYDKKPQVLDEHSSDWDRRCLADTHRHAFMHCIPGVLHDQPWLISVVGASSRMTQTVRRNVRESFAAGSHKTHEVSSKEKTRL